MYPMRPSWVVLMLLAALSALSACLGGTTSSMQDETSAAQLRQPTTGRQTAPRALIDLPAALPLLPADFRARFGEPLPLPLGFLDLGKNLGEGAAPTDSLAMFQPQGLPLIVSFDRRTGAVKDALVLGPDEATLMRQASLAPNAPHYLLLPVFYPSRPGKLLGLRVVPK